jgi:glycosyltransferase involved in cell wall biosynthesis
MAPPARPKVSFIIPTLNAAALLDNCLAAIDRQTWPREAREIILADAGSTDGTRDIAARYGALVLDDRGQNMEEGKRLALAHATGEYVCFVDADNEISAPDYLELAITALAAHPQALGVEAYYPPSPKMSSFCAYLTHLLHLGDPIVWLMSVNPVRIATAGEVERWTLPPGTQAYPLGANGFVFRRADLESVRAREQFQDTHVALHLMAVGKREWLRLRGRGVHHYYVQTLGGFLHKRRRAMVHFLNVRRRSKLSWMTQKPPVPGWLACLYGLTFLGPAVHTVIGLGRDRDARWLWHVPASFVSVLGIAWGLWTFWTRSNEDKLIARLQPKQTLKEPTAAAPKPEAKP